MSDILTPRELADYLRVSEATNPPNGSPWRNPARIPQREAVAHPTARSHKPSGIGFK